MKKKAFVSGGGKGGIGKTFTVAASMDAFKANGIDAISRETDTTNSSLRQMGLCDHDAWNLKDVAGQGGMAGLVDEFAGGYKGNAFIDLGARDEEIFLGHVEWFREALAEHGVELIWMRPITLNAYTVLAAQEFNKRFPTIPQILLVNLGQGRNRKDFTLWDESDFRRDLLEGNAVEIELEEFSPILADNASALGLSFNAIVDGDFGQVEEGLRPYAEAIFSKDRRRFVKFYLDRHYKRLVQAVDTLSAKSVPSDVKAAEAPKGKEVQASGSTGESAG